MPELILQYFLVCFNFTNVNIDAYKILKHKSIAHGINFGAYLTYAIALFYFFVKPDLNWSGFPYLNFSIYLLCTFCNRQISFDIPLNIRRGLKWDYVSTANPPASITDRIEIFIFGRNGRLPVYVYSALWLITITLSICLH